MVDSTAIVEWIERDDGTKVIRDRTGAEVDMTAAEAACKARGAHIVFKRPSEDERELREALEDGWRGAGLYEPIGIRNDPTEPVDLILRHPHGFEFARVESPLGESVKALRDLLAEHDLLAVSS